MTTTSARGEDLRDTYTLTSPLVPEPVKVEALVAGGNGADLPVIYLLHGGGGGDGFVDRLEKIFRRAWDDEVLPPAVVVTPHVGRSFYMNFRDRSELWEDFVIGPLLDDVRERFGAATTRAATVVVGISMGGMGALRLSFKHPDVFAGVAALEPGIEPVLSYSAIELEDRFWRGPDLFERIFGSPVDEEYWQQNNPANIAAEQADALRESGLRIYLECGDEDSFGLHRGSEFLHRLLYDNGVPHEYRLVRGADHVGASIPGRFEDALRFLARTLRPEAPDPELPEFRARIQRWRAAAGI